VLLAIRSQVSHIKCGRHGLDAPLTSGYVLAPAPLRECAGRATRWRPAHSWTLLWLPRREARICVELPPAMIVTVASGSRPEGPHGSGVNGLTRGPTTPPRLAIAAGQKACIVAAWTRWADQREPSGINRTGACVGPTSTAGTASPWPRCTDPAQQGRHPEGELKGSDENRLSSLFIPRSALCCASLLAAGLLVPRCRGHRSWPRL
jgi:hypothetical protein